MKEYKYDFYTQKLTFFINGFKVGSISIKRLLRKTDAVNHTDLYNDPREITTEFANALSVVTFVDYTILKHRPFIEVNGKRIYLDTADNAQIEKSFVPCTPIWQDLNYSPAPMVIEYLKERGLTGQTIHNRKIPTDF